MHRDLEARSMIVAMSGEMDQVVVESGSVLGLKPLSNKYISMLFWPVSMAAWIGVDVGRKECTG